MVYLLFSYRDPLAQMGNWGYIGVAIAKLGKSAVIIIPTPAPAYTFAMGALLNPLIIGIVGGLAAASGEMIGYYLGVRSQTIARRGRLYTQGTGTHHPFRRSRPIHLRDTACPFRLRRNLGRSRSLSAFKVRPHRGRRQDHQSHDYRDVQLLRSPVARRGIDCHSQHSKTTL
jgi:hypothetical protein